MLASLEYHSKIINANDMVIIEFTSGINKNKYAIKHTRIYQQKDIYTIDHFDYIVGDLQLQQGILGLPKESSQTNWINNHFHQGNPLEGTVLKSLQYRWKRELNKKSHNAFY